MLLKPIPHTKIKLIKHCTKLKSETTRFLNCLVPSPFTTLFFILVQLNGGSQNTVNSFSKNSNLPACPVSDTKNLSADFTRKNEVGNLGDPGERARALIEQGLEAPLEELKKKTSEEILELIKACGRGRDLLFPSGKVDYGLNSEIDPLKALLVHRPGPEVELVDEKDPWKWLYYKKPDLDKALPEYDNMIELIKREARAETIFLYTPSAEGTLIFPPNQWFPRDHGFMTPYGAIVGNSDPPRVYEEYFVMRKLLALDIPVIFKVYGAGRMESGDAIYLDEKTLLVGHSYRTNHIGYEQIKAVLESWIVDQVVDVPVRSDFMHLDGAFNIASETVTAVCPEGVPEEFINFVKNKGFDMIRVPEQESTTLATNWLCLAPGKILFVDGEEKMNISTRKELEKRGIDVVSWKMPELIGGAGGPRCMTMPLLRRKD